MKKVDDADDKKRRKVEGPTAAWKELNAFPEGIKERFVAAFVQLSWDRKPSLPITHLGVVGKGVVELKIQGSPAYRVVYTMKFTGKVIVLAARTKSKNGSDAQLIEAAASRLKSYN